MSDLLKGNLKELSKVPTTMCDSDQIETTSSEEGKDYFSSRWAYWLAAIGCSVGFGNVWRFPYLIYDYGGASFFIPFLLSLILVVMPLVILEFGIGQLSQCGLFAAHNSLSDRSRAAGWGVLTSFNVLQFYPLLLGWSLIYFFNSFSRNFGWAVSDEEKQYCESITDLGQCTDLPVCQWRNNVCKARLDSKANDFYEMSCNINPDPTGRITSFSWQLMLCEMLLWTSVFWASVKGARVLGYLTYVTMTLPAIFLITLAIVGATLPGSGIGINAYIVKFDLGALSSDVWGVALGQAIFSMGALQGSMCGYACHNHPKQNFFQDVWVVAAGDFFFAFLSGFVSFSVAGHLAHEADVPLELLDLSGSALVFQTFPVGLATIPFPGAQILSAMFFLTLWLLGFSTIIGLLEAQTTVVRDSKYGQKLRRWQIVLGLCLLMMAFGFLYCTDMATHLLDCFDYFSGNVSTVLFGWAFSVSGGWCCAYNRTVEAAGLRATQIHTATWLFGSVFAPMIGFFVPSGEIVGPCVGAALMGGGLVWALAITKKNDEFGIPMKFRTRIYNLCFLNVEILRKGFNDQACENTCWRIPSVWSFMLKYFNPVIIMILFWLTLSSSDGTFNLPGNGIRYPPWIFFMGSIFPMIAMALVVVSFIVPYYFDFMLPVPEDIVRLSFLKDTEVEVVKAELEPKDLEFGRRETFEGNNTIENTVEEGSV